MFDINRFEHFYIHPDSIDSEVALRIYSLVPSAKITVTDTLDLKTPKGMLSADDFARSKKNVYLKKHKGQFFKRCPGAGPGLTCCNYFVLNLGLQCDMNCSYCYLQSFINSPTIEIYSNIDEALVELDSLWSKDAPLRVGTGEVIDSLSMDPLTLYSKKLIHFFRERPKWLLEFKTKSNYVDQFIMDNHSGNVVVSWSVNPEYIVSSEEHGTASLSARLKAALDCKKQGFKISFHVDPVIYHEGWEANYKELVQQIVTNFTPQDIPYVSLGALRFQKEQKAMMRKRFGFTSHVVNSEMFVGQDGKLRYDENLRKTMFNFIINEFKTADKNWNVFLCMENHEVWLSTFGAAPKSVEGLTSLFEGRRTFPQPKSVID